MNPISPVRSGDTQKKDRVSPARRVFCDLIRFPASAAATTRTCFTFVAFEDNEVGTLDCHEISTVERENGTLESRKRQNWPLTRNGPPPLLSVAFTLRSTASAG